jgi:hypothetical protein
LKRAALYLRVSTFDRRSSITELTFHGINTSRQKARSFTHVSGTKLAPMFQAAHFFESMTHVGASHYEYPRPPDLGTLAWQNGYAERPIGSIRQAALIM